MLNFFKDKCPDNTSAEKMYKPDKTVPIYKQLVETNHNPLGRKLCSYCILFVLFEMLTGALIFATYYNTNRHYSAYRFKHNETNEFYKNIKQIIQQSCQLNTTITSNSVEYYPSEHFVRAKKSSSKKKMLEMLEVIDTNTKPWVQLVDTLEKHLMDIKNNMRNQL